MTKRLRFTAALMAAVSLGCYSYVPVPMDQVSVGLRARARLSPDEATRLAPVIGREDRLVEGQVIEASEQRLLLAVPTATAVRGMSAEQFHQRIELPRTGILELEQRQFSRIKTGFAIGGAAVVVGAALVAAFKAIDRNTGEDKPGPDNIVVPVLRFD